MDICRIKASLLCLEYEWLVEVIVWWKDIETTLKDVTEEGDLWCFRLLATTTFDWHDKEMCYFTCDFNRRDEVPKEAKLRPTIVSYWEQIWLVERYARQPSSVPSIVRSERRSRQANEAVIVILFVRIADPSSDSLPKANEFVVHRSIKVSLSCWHRQSIVTKRGSF